MSTTGRADGTTPQVGAKLAANGLDAQAPAVGGSPALPKRPERGEEIELQIDSLAHGGEGVGRLALASVAHDGQRVSDEAGYVVFVSGAIPGDRVRAVVVKRKRSYAHARMVEVLSPGPERIEPVARHPGVAWQVLPYERQLQIKREQVDDALRRIGRLDGFELEEIVPAVSQWRYRNKLEYSWGTGHYSDSSSPSAGPENTGNSGTEVLVCGFHAPGGWKRVDPIEDCLLASQQGNRAREVALAWARAQGLRAWDRRRESIAAAEVPLLRNLVVREGRRSGKLQIRLVSTDGELDVPSLAAALVAELGSGAGGPDVGNGPDAEGGPGAGNGPDAERGPGAGNGPDVSRGEGGISGVLWTRSSSLAETTMGGETELVWGEAELPERLGDLDLRISCEAFFQTNTEMAEALYGVVAEYAALEGWERVYDLYCGIGTIALSLAPRAGELWGIELVEQAVADAIAAAKRNEVTNAHFFAGDARLALAELVERAGRPDLVVVDPPRAGLSQKVVRRVIEASPKRIVYVSCNPTTLAPNAAQLVEAGWRLLKVRPVDMFPQTPHIECVALLERG
ncbi:MAG TPA: 23S rRNA (uracil(1939)-C(5))-methyltransferase RlmD [Solirubrobacteraceae bacterium]|jgi:23S rRNA (uracil1939-C5)-methyltransferase|nr:23S rRNA (uracil(1939)-C(5))-methyltransferase RlmD [Solirubrobacteraceae bacterium]